ncbi:MAG: TIGR02302 family protein [Xanthobacteraceae bacterium]|nr:TIGR02302 family protein [Xanthobacteraceae bacterium]
MSGAPEKQKNELPSGVVREALSALSAAVFRARQALLWESVWPVLVSLISAAGIFLALSWAGLWISLPPYARIIGVALFALLVIAALVPAVRIRMPGLRDAVSRLDRTNIAAHRPATALTDKLATKSEDPMAAALWRAHLQRTAEAAKNLRAGVPQPKLALRDPFALRAAILLAVVATFFIADTDRNRRLIAAFDWTGALTPRLYRVDAWITPPVYTGRAPVLLAGIRHDEAAPGEVPQVSVPAGSILIVRGTNLAALDLVVDGNLQEQPNQNPDAAKTGVERHFKITEDARLTVKGLPVGEAKWSFRAIPDRVPVIELSKDPEITGRNALSLSYRMDDDYGVTAAEAQFERVIPFVPHAQPNALPPRPLVLPPNFALSLPQARTKNGAGQTAKDLTEHPWAGAAVRLTLVARDEAGNKGKSEPRQTRIPMRSFQKPIARALIEQRRELAFDANVRGRVQAALDALMIAPERFTPEANVYLGLRTASTRLKIARTDDDLRGVIDYLWEIAVLIEDGTLSDVERDLRAAENALRQALERNASDEEIKKLMDQLRAALDRYLQALAEQQRRDNNNTNLERPDPNTRVVRPQDLKNMLDQIERMAKNGDRQGAQKLLDQLQSLMENLQKNRRQAGPQQNQNNPLDQLGRMIQEQQRLRDRTFRQGQDNRRQQQDQGQQKNNQMGQLQQGQGDLRQQLERMLEQLRKRQQGQGQGEGDEQGPGKDAADALNRAEQAMRDAENSLGQGDADGAVESQGRALSQLRRGAQAMADAMQQGGPGDGPGFPEGPEADSAERTDPLGRPVRNREFGDDYTVKVPDEIDTQRARRVLEELRRRLSDPSRPRLELDYLDRLLQDY